MKTRRRIRGTIKWGGAVLTVLLLIVWVGSRWYTGYVFFEPTIAIGVLEGQVLIGWEHPWSAVPLNWQSNIERSNSVFEWWFQFDRNNRSTIVAIPTWFLVVLTGVPVFLLWRYDRKLVPGTCRKCGYSRTGLPADRACPECGTSP